VTYVVPWWSPSKFVCWDTCPREFYLRYVQRVPMVPTEALHFGTAVHKGLEAHFQGGDGEVAFRRTWRTLSDELRQSGYDVASHLSRTGLELIEKVTALGLVGEPERKVWIRTDAYLGAPILGYADLWSPQTDTIFDFKTTVGAWSAARAEKEVWQPCLYSYAYRSEMEVLPRFEYIVLNRVTGTLERFETQRSDDQIMDALSRAREIATAVQREQFDCQCRTGADCPECGARWEHGHVCDLSKSTKIRLSGTDIQAA
jgi:PD-(D/E)XK nuclease superfamily